MKRTSEDLGLTREFVRALRDWKPEQSRIDDTARALLMDGLAVCLAGSRESGPEILSTLIVNQGSQPACTVVGRNFRASACAAAHVNALSMHVLDYEPMWNPPNHALSTLLPALLALGEQRERSGSAVQGRNLVNALAKGIEAQGRLRAASGMLKPSELNFHPPSAVGPVASAIACSEFLGLTEDQTIHAAGIACSRAGGLLVNIGSMTKALHCGDATRNGLEAAMLAATGFTSNTNPFEGAQGYAEMILGKTHDPEVLRGPVSRPFLCSPGPAWKLYPSQFATQFAIVAALECRQQLAADSEIHSVTILGPVMPYIDRQFPVTGLDGKFSMQYCCAVALLDGEVGIDSFSDHRLASRDIQRLLEQITLVQSPEIAPHLDSMSVRVSVRHGRNAVAEGMCDALPGSWSNPLPLERVWEKCHSIIRKRLSEQDYRGFCSEISKPVDSMSILSLMHAVRAYSD
jgi:aconitate decarboxylase